MSFQVRRERCASCIYNKSTPLDLAKLERQALDQDTYRICHHTKDAVCRGFWNRHKNHFNLGRIMQRIGGVRFTDEDAMPSLSELSEIHTELATLEKTHR